MSQVTRNREVTNNSSTFSSTSTESHLLRVTFSHLPQTSLSPKFTPSLTSFPNSSVWQIMMPHPPTSPQVSPSFNSARVLSPPGVKDTYPNEYQGDLHTKQTQMPDSGQTALQQSIPKTDSNSIPYPTRPIPTQNLLVTIASYLYSILLLAFAFSITMAVRERCKCSATLSHI